MGLGNGQRGWQRAATCTTLMPTPRSCTLRPLVLGSGGGVGENINDVVSRGGFLCLDLHPKVCAREDIALPARAGQSWKDTDCRSHTSLLVLEDNAASPQAFAAIGKALATPGEFLCPPPHQFGVDALPLLRLLYAGQRLRHFLEFLFFGGTMEAIGLAFAPHCIEGSTTKNRCVVTVTVGVIPHCPREAAIIPPAIPPPQNQSPLRPVLNPRSGLFSPPPTALAAASLHDCIPLA
jgi:hypothetical protein